MCEVFRGRRSKAGLPCRTVFAVLRLFHPLREVYP